MSDLRHDIDRASRLARATAVSGASGKVCPAERATQLLEAIIEPGDRVAIEGDNQKQADFLASALAKVDPARVHDLHMVQSVLALPDHLAVFERGIANRLDFAFAGPQSRRLAELVASNALKIGAIHTYLELYARMLVDLTPHVALVVADQADRDGNLYTGPNTEDTPTLVEAAAFHGGIIVAQVNELVDRVPRVDVPGGWVDVVIPSPKPYQIEPLFTRDPAKIRDENVLMAMMAIAAIYEPYEVRRLNHGIGYATAAIELILPTFAGRRGLKGKIAQHFVLNPHPTLIPAIEAGFVDSIYCFGSELGMERYVSSRPDVFPIGADGNRRSNRALAQVAGQYACDLFIGGTLQIDAQGNSSTATKGRITGFGGAPNMGADPRGRRHDSSTWLRAGEEAGESLRGRKLVVQMVQTRQPNGAPSFVERLDAFDLAASAGFALPPVMIYGDDLTHVITERGAANLLRCRSPQEREAALRAVAGDTEFGKRQSPETGDSLRRRGIVMYPSDLGIDGGTATRDWLPAKSIDDLCDSFGRALRPAGKIPAAPTVEKEALMTPVSPISGDLCNRKLAPLDHAKQLAATLLSERGEASGALVARQLHEVLRTLDESDRHDFQRYIATEFQPDKAALSAAAERYLADTTAAAAAALARAADPPRQELLRRMNMAAGGTGTLIAMRSDITPRLRGEPELKLLDADLRHLFASWFNRGFLELRRIDWQIPAAVLEKLIAYEAVHEIKGWDDLRRRLDPDRRCFAFFHPALPGEPLIFVEVALVEGLATSMPPLLSQDRDESAAGARAMRADTAIFYSISNCQDGLRGVSLGDFLIKQVVEELQAEFPQLKRFSTLSPVPGFGRWLNRRLDASGAEAAEASVALFRDDEAKRLIAACGVMTNAIDAFRVLANDGEWWRDTARVGVLQRPLLRLCAEYLTRPNKGLGAIDPVARFHLGNGARLERINWLGNTAPRAIQESFGIMVNYVYDHDSIEDNHEAFVGDGIIVRSREVDTLLET